MTAAKNFPNQKQPKPSRVLLHAFVPCALLHQFCSTALLPTFSPRSSLLRFSDKKSKPSACLTQLPVVSCVFTKHDDTRNTDATLTHDRMQKSSSILQPLCRSFHYVTIHTRRFNENTNTNANATCDARTEQNRTEKACDRIFEEPHCARDVHNRGLAYRALLARREITTRKRQRPTF